MRWKAPPELLPALEALFPPDASPDDLPEGAELLKDSPVRRVYRLDREGFGGPVLVKRYRPGNLAEGLRDLVRRSVAEREWRAARWLASRNVPVAEPLACGIPRRLGFPDGSFYICRFIEGGASVHETLVEGKADRALWETLGRFLSDLHRADCYHPDLHLGNVLARMEGGEWSLVLVDLHALSPGVPLTPARAERNLAQIRNSFIAGSPKDFLRGLRAYREGGLPPGVDPSGLARRVTAEADRLLEAFFRRRTARCLKSSTRFAKGGSGGLRSFRRREVDLAELGATLAASRTGSGTVMKEGGHTRLVADLCLGGKKVVLKEYRPRGLGQRLRGLFGSSRGRDAWVGGNGLLERGVEAVKPLALVEEGIAWTVGLSVVVLEDRRDLPQLDRFLARAQKEGGLAPARAWARALGRFIGDLHRCGIYHADLKACNLLVEGSGSDAPRFVLLDHDRLLFGSPVTGRRLLKNLVQLNTSLPRGLSRALRARFLRAYVRHAGREGGWKALWREVLRESRGKGIVYVSDEGDVFEEPF